MIDSLLKWFVYFIFIFIDSYIYLRIFLREKLFYKPLIEFSNFKKYFISIDKENHFVWEIGNKDAVKVGSKFSRFCLIPESAHFNVIENPKSCANAVYDFINSLR